MKQLAEKSHSLIGAAANCGLPLLADSASTLKAAAEVNDEDSIPALLTAIRSVRSRIELPNQAGEYLLPAAAEVESTDADDETDNGPIRSSLPVHKAKFHAIVSGFVDDLDSRFEAIENALNQGDEESLMQLAHAIKGASGNCGFATLSQTAAQLENSAREGELDTAPDLVKEMRSIQSRIEMPAIEEA